MAITNAENVYAINPGVDEPAPSKIRTTPVRTAIPAGQAKVFPALKEGAAHFDGPGGTQTPSSVADAVHSTLVAAIANRGSVTAADYSVFLSCN